MRVQIPTKKLAKRSLFADAWGERTWSTVAQIQTPPRHAMMKQNEMRARIFLLKRFESRKAPNAKLMSTPKQAFTNAPRALRGSPLVSIACADADARR